MLSIRHSLLILFVILPALANEEGGEKNDKKGEKSPGREYTEKTTKMNALSVKILDSQRDFDKLVDEKQHERDPKRLQQVLKDMVDVIDTRNKDAEEYSRLRQELLYQYPNKSSELNRLYQTQEKKDLSEMESSADLDDLLTRVKKVIERKFAPLMPDDEKKAAAPMQPPAEEPKKLRLEK